MIGQTISRHTSIDKLSEGGLGMVYKAHNTTLERDVALKFLPNCPTSYPKDAKPTRYILIGFLTLFVSCWLCGQEVNRVIVFPDSAPRISFELGLMSFYIPARFSVPPSFQYGMYSFADLHGSHEPMELVPLFVPLPGDRPKLYIETIWQNSLQQERKYELLWTVLGSMEMGGAAYIAYRHIKRYGLW
jgi:serine/threonine protein kinase